MRTAIYLYVVNKQRCILLAGEQQSRLLNEGLGTGVALGSKQVECLSFSQVPDQREETSEQAS